jgi:Holliday junction resolvase
MDYLLRDFQDFWRENSDIWVEKFDYKEAAPHLILMAFLQRIINGGGDVIREMAAGTKRLDLCVVYKKQKYLIEIKLRRGEKYLEKGLAQTADYMDIHGCSEAWVIVFDRRPKVKWKNKIYMKKEIIDGKTITVVGA